MSLLTLLRRHPPLSVLRGCSPGTTPGSLPQGTPDPTGPGSRPQSSLAVSSGWGATWGQAGSLRNPPNAQERSRKRSSSREHGVLSPLSACPAEAPIPGGGSWCCCGRRRGGGDTRRASRAPERAATAHLACRPPAPPHSRPREQGRTGPSEDESKGQERATAHVPGESGAPGHTHGSPVGPAGVGHKDTCPRGRAWPGLLPQAEGGLQPDRRPGPARERRASVGHRAWSSSGLGRQPL